MAEKRYIGANLGDGNSGAYAYYSGNIFRVRENKDGTFAPEFNFHTDMWLAFIDNKGKRIEGCTSINVALKCAYQNTDGNTIRDAIKNF